MKLEQHVFILMDNLTQHKRNVNPMHVLDSKSYM